MAEITQVTLKTEEWYEQSQFKLTLSSRCSFLKSKVFKRTQTQRLWAVSAFGNSKPVPVVTCARVRGHWRLQTFCITGSPTSSGPQRGWLQVVMSRGVKLRSLNILTNKLMWPLTLTPPLYSYQLKLWDEAGMSGEMCWVAYSFTNTLYSWCKCWCNLLHFEMLQVKAT